MTGYEIFDRINSGDAAARRGLDDFCLPLAALISNLQIILDPEAVVIGGGISAQPVLLAAIREQLEKLNRAYPLPRPESRVLAARLGNRANLIGAARVWRAKYGKEPQ